MKMFRLFTGMIFLVMFTLTGCGNQSPDFTSQLSSMTLVATPVAPATSTTSIAVGDQIQFTATGKCTTPPGSPTAFVDCEVKNSSITWSVTSTPAGKVAGTIDENGLFTAGPDTGTAKVKGTSGSASATSDVSATLDVVVGPPAVRTLVITKPATPATIAQGSTQDYEVKGVFSDGVTRDLNPTETPITWSVGAESPAVATLSTTTGNTTTATGVSQGETLVSASTTVPSIAPATSLLTVDGSTLESLNGVALVPGSRSVAVGSSATFQLMGNYSDGSVQAIPNSDIDWTTADPTIAELTAAAGDNKVSAKGLLKGTATITATLKTGVAPLILAPNRAKSGTLVVFDAFCTTPLIAPTATTDTATAGLLCLLCNVANEERAIDTDPLNFASLNSTIGVGLLSSQVSLSVHSNVAPFAAGSTAGFIIGRPAGALLSAEVLASQVTITTLSGNAPVESFSVGGGGILPPVLRLTLLGLLGNSNAALLSLTTTQPYDGVRITFGTGLASLLTTTQVFAACGTVDLTALPAP